MISISAHLDNFHFLAFRAILKNLKKALSKSYWTDWAEIFLGLLVDPYTVEKKVIYSSEHFFENPTTLLSSSFCQGRRVGPVVS